eukprot:CAMPEP_0172308120 /NCGR_PEP_ID=MMETSP1058-20130122/8824_1 /TAXON_ID=83371 /ORGANISM="Detonula confervacea, Strain CCMP 353" /LENGTH=165 /DNA_ID=CAMNT_0013020477 /DNA_START=19 /DNA_END=513 /DNA_ORIENTATION=-
MTNPIVNVYSQDGNALIGIKERRSLVVDFGHCCKSYVDPKAKRSVQFSAVQDVRFYERNSESHASEMFYSEAEYKAMKKARRRVVNDIHKRYYVLVESSGGCSDIFNDCSLTGIENLLTPAILEKITRHRRGCLAAVLGEQSRQGAAGEYDPYTLALISQMRSRW